MYFQTWHSFGDFFKIGSKGILCPRDFTVATIVAAFLCGIWLYRLYRHAAPVSEKLVAVLLPSFLGSMLTTAQFCIMIGVIMRAGWTGPIGIEEFALLFMGSAIWGFISSTFLFLMAILFRLLNRLKETKGRRGAAVGHAPRGG